MKFDMGKAWSHAMVLLSSNLGLIATMLGLFYFLPPFAFALLFPELANPPPPDMPANVPPEVAFEAMTGALQEQFANSWPILVVTTVISYMGSIAVLTLFAKDRNPTVGEALKAGFFGGLIYLLTQVIISLATGLTIGLIGGLVVALLPLLGIILFPLLLAAFIYVLVKTWLVPAVIAIEGEMNPINAIKKSWALTKGNSLRIFGFLVVLFLVAGLAILVATMVLTTVFAVFGEPVASMGAGFVSSLAGAVMGGLMLVVTASIHSQLSGSIEEEVETFE